MTALEQHTDNHTERTTYFVDIALPLRIPQLYTYRVPRELEEFLQEGIRVIVQFGRKKIMTGIVVNVHDKPPGKYEAKYILDVLDDFPLVNQKQFQLYDWISKYYLCSFGETLNAALPSGLKLSSESKIQLNPDFEGDISELTDVEISVVQALSEKDLLDYSDVSDLIGAKGVHKLITIMVEKGVILLIEQIKEKYTPKKIKKFKVAEALLTDNKLEQTVNDLEKKPKQQAILLSYLQRSDIFSNPNINEEGIDKSILKELELSESSYKTLIKNGILEEWQETISRFDGMFKTSEDPYDLSNAQEDSKKQIYQSFEEHDVCLFQGVTGSGKTEVYIHLIKEAIESGSQVLYLLPEIALTTQIVKRLKKVFGDVLGIYHSKFSDNERVDIWKDLINDRVQVIIGVRSSVFLPFDNLGLILIDEEHDSSFKQYDPAPRYNARDSAIMMAHFHQAKVLLGTATPSIESFHKARTGKWGYVNLSERFGEAVLPKIEVVQTQFNVSLSEQLKDGLIQTLENKKQAIVFQNRRGYAPYVICNTCTHIPQCKNCNVSLTYHMYSNELRCHYCGHSESVPSQCDACGSREVSTKGFGTEKIEEEIGIIIPEAAIQRMDLDTTRKKNSYDQIITSFEQQNVDILVGTQMVTKGLDFDNVTLVGVFDADRMIHFPDFRSHERAFQLITQVAGRAGRKKEQGRVIVQSHDRTHPIFKLILDHDYETFFQQEIYERRKYNYPPYCRMIRIIFRDYDKDKSSAFAAEVTQALKSKLGQKRVLGPQEPGINKIRNMYLNECIIKLENSVKNVSGIKESIVDLIYKFNGKKEFKKCSFVVDVDPV